MSLVVNLLTDLAAVVGFLASGAGTSPSVRAFWSGAEGLEGQFASLLDNLEEGSEHKSGCCFDMSLHLFGRRVGGFVSRWYKFTL